MSASSAPRTAVLLLGHGSVDDLADLPAFLTNIRRGHAPSPSLIDEVQRRYRAIGGVSPLNALCRQLAVELGARLQLEVRYAGRQWAPSARLQLEALAAAGVTRVVVLPLAQHSAPIYMQTARESAEGLGLEIVGVDDWGSDPRLIQVFAARVRAALSQIAEGTPSRVLFTAHSLPVAVLRAGDRYAEHVEHAAKAIAAAAGVPEVHVIYQSQGMSEGPGGRPVEWLGPDLLSALQQAARDGKKHVLIAPVGFLADHVEILYDLDIEAKAQAEALGLATSRTASLNHDADFVAVLEGLVRARLEPSAA